MVLFWCGFVRLGGICSEGLMRDESEGRISACSEMWLSNLSCTIALGALLCIFSAIGLLLNTFVL